jgi:hypothetical protein|uniref:Uncharacterized protein n=1 Tax=Zea mays TaxID=4577 RepID=A0A804MW65_MAIZE
MFSRQTGSYVRLTTQSNDARTSIHAYQQSLTAGAAARRYIIRIEEPKSLSWSRPSRHTNLTFRDTDRPAAAVVNVEAAEIVGVVPASGLVGAHLGRPAAGPGPQGAVVVDDDDDDDAEGGAVAPRRQPSRGGPLAPRGVPLAADAPRRRRRLIGRNHSGEPRRGGLRVPV